MNKIITVSLSLILCIVLCSCSNSGQGDMGEPSSEPPTQSETAPEQSSEVAEPSQSKVITNEAESKPETDAVAYPFEDSEGRVHHQIYINGELVETDHDAYTYPDEPKGAYYPIVEILEHLGVECLFDEHLEALTTRINGQVITCKSDNSDIVVGKTTLGGAAPKYIDGCFYVPSYTFMHLLDAVVDFNTDRSGVTINTEKAIDTADSGTAGLSISAEAIPGLGEALYSGAQTCPTCGGTGRAICTSCSGTGGTTQYIQKRDPISGQMTIQSSRGFCSRCGASGRSTCPTCGGTGSR